MSSRAEAALTAAAEPLRAELTVHCYRMLGSVAEAEDAVQDTMVRAWRAWDRYDASRASLRTWLYAIATNVCLTSLEGRARRPLPSGLGAPSVDPKAPLRPDFEVPWLQPLPDTYLASLGQDPAERLVQRQGVRLALVAALQLLPPRQRAVLVLRDVLAFTAPEVAEQLSTTTASVTSALQRARTTMAEAALREDEVIDPQDWAVLATIERYVRAFEAADVPALVELLTSDVVLEMPPVPLWFVGPEDYGKFIARVFTMRGAGWRLRPLHANGQPALAAYAPDPEGVLRLHTLQVLTVRGDAVSRNVVFQDAAVFAAFELAPVLVA